MRALAALALLLVVLPSVAAQLPPVRPPTESLGDPERVEAELKALAEENPDLVRFSVLGQSVGGRDLWRLDIALFADPAWESRPALLVDGGHHGNEFSGIHAARFFALQLVDAAREDASVLAGKRVVVIPVVNPDGWVLASRYNANGVNLNRNYPYGWNGYGTDPAPYMPNYAGPAEGSEPETKLVMQAMASVDLRAYVSYHCCGPEPGGELVLPWSRETDGPIPDWDVYERFLALARGVGVAEHRDPSGLGESIAHAYGNLGAFSVLPETPAAANPKQDDAARAAELREQLAVPFLALGHLLDLGARLEAVVVGVDTVTVRNVGFGAARNVTAGGDVVPVLAPGASVTLPLDACGVSYERMQIRIEGRSFLGRIADACPSAPGAAIPLPSVVAFAGAVAAGAFVLRRRAGLA